MTYIIDALTRSVVLLIVAGVVTLLLYRRQASLRALVWTAALAGVLVLPLAGRVLPSLRVAVLPAEPAVRPDPAPPVLLKSDASGLEPTKRSEQSTYDEGTAAPFEADQTGVLPAVEPVQGPFPWMLAVLGIWALGSTLILLRLVRSYRALSHIADGQAEAESEWQKLIDQVRGELGIRRTVRARMTGMVTVPAVAGLWRPVLLIPEDGSEWSEGVRRDVVRHELAHVARWDAVGQLIDHLACAVYWFNPIAWIAARQAAGLRERACDDVVLRAGSRASEYANNLLHLARQALGTEQLEPAALAMARPNRIRERVMNVLNAGARRESVSGRAALAVMLLAGGTIGTIAAVKPAARIAEFDETPDVVVTSVTPGHMAESVGTAGLTSVNTGLGVEFRSARDTSGLCSGGHGSHSSSISENNGVRKWELKISGTDCEVWLRAQGKFEFNDEFTDLASISRGGYFRLDVTQRGVRRQLEIRPSGDGLERVYRVDGAEHAYDAEARAWFAAFLIELDRQTAIAVDKRLPILLRQGGVAAVLKETGLMSSDYARNEYYKALMEQRRLTVAERRELLGQAARLMESDYYGSELIKLVVSQGRLQDPDERQAVVGMIKRMESDYYKSEAIKLLTSGSLTGEQMDALLQVTAGMESDYYKSEMLQSLLSEGELTGSQRATVVKAATTIESDYYIGEVLKLIAAKGLLGPEERAAFLQTVSRMENDNSVSEVLQTLLNGHEATAAEVRLILGAVPGVESDYYRSEILGEVLGSKAVTESDLMDVVALIRKMESDYYAAETLQKVVEHAAATDGVRRAVREAAENLSGYYRDEVRRVSSN